MLSHHRTRVHYASLPVVEFANVGNMDLSRYFGTNDGSLPEVDVAFSDPALVPIAFEHLFDRGARDASAHGGSLWIRASKAEKRFSGPEDALLVISGTAESFHVVLSGITGSDCPIPDVGVCVFDEGLKFDYRMGSEWGQPQIQSFLTLLHQLRMLGGVVSIPWWGSDGERDFLAALGEF
jgi:hypothetical protein